MKLSNEVKAKYQFVNNTFILTAKDDPRDRITVEIGDSKQPDTFYPQVKIQRWDNEVNASFRLKDDQPASEALSTSQEKIVWTKGTKEAHFYEVAPSEEHPEGGYEFEIILKEKPTTNRIEFSLETKGLEFFYQPALTQQEIDEGAIRPENVVGSYAVYYTDCPANYVGAKLYRVGKAFHIFRPRIEDAVGNWVWGDLHADVQGGSLTVEIPQTFLDGAVYPVRHAAGLELGYHTEGATDYYRSADFGIMESYATKLIPSVDGIVDSITAYAKYNSGSANIKAVLWDNTTGNLITDGVGGVVALASSYGWKTASYSTKPSVTTDYTNGYGPGFIGENAWYCRTDATPGVSNSVQDTSNSYSIPEDMGGRSTSAYHWSIYATYTAAGGTTTQTSTAKADIRAQGVTKTVQARSRVKQTGPTQTLQAKGRLKQTPVTNTLQAQARTKVADVTQTVQSKSKLKQLDITESLGTKANVVLYGEWSDVWTVNVISTASNTATGKARLKQLEVSQTAQTRARISQPAATRTAQAKGRIEQASVARTSTARARVQQAAVTRTTQAKARLLQTASKTAQARARVRQLGVSRTLQGKAMVLSGESKILQAKAAVKQLAVTNSATARARVLQTASTSTTAKARVKQSAVQTTQAKGRIEQEGVTKSLAAKARIRPTGTKSAQAKARMKVEQTKTLTAKANLSSFGLTTKTAQARGNIQSSGMSALVQARGRVRKTVGYEETAKANITSEALQTISARCRLGVTTGVSLQAGAYVVRFAEGKIISAARTIEGIIRARDGRVGIIRADRLNR